MNLEKIDLEKTLNLINSLKKDKKWKKYSTFFGKV